MAKSPNDQVVLVPLVTSVAHHGSGWLVDLHGGSQDAASVPATLLEQYLQVVRGSIAPWSRAPVEPTATMRWLATANEAM